MPNSVELKPNLSNIFGVEEPDVWNCYIAGYSASHSNLWITAVNQDRHLHFVFTSVHFIDATTTWKSANFGTAPSNECVFLLRKLKSLENMPESEWNYVLEHLFLVVVSASDYPIRFIVSGAFRYDRVPDFFK